MLEVAFVEFCLVQHIGQFLTTCVWIERQRFAPADALPDWTTSPVALTTGFTFKFVMDFAEYDIVSCVLQELLLLADGQLRSPIFGRFEWVSPRIGQLFSSKLN